ncbi:3',5'-cyclic-AMP phosphodiesterase [Rosenbergiella australiborealis]|uniref:3',5'-cyclic-AMP phosphodiesterase n=1 Tax=Rosenbergiella australiborealis TaxID=1544696 RepID=UPI001F4DE053
MNSLVLEIANNRSVRLLQLTDMHLFRTPHESLLGVNTWQSYQAVLAAVSAERHNIDLVVATGDLAQDQSPEAYLAFAAGIHQLQKPCVWLPGNHDFQPAMVNTLAHQGICPQKSVLLGAHWQLLLLDSQVHGVPHGLLSDYQLQGLSEALARHPQRHTVILLHHHPTPSGCTWLDAHSLRNAHQLAEVLQHYPLAKTIVCGHIHQEMDADWQGRRVLSTPSTCVQFRPQCTGFTIDSLSPGWRWLELHPNGEISTRVERLSDTQFQPDLHSEGY